MMAAYRVHCIFVFDEREEADGRPSLGVVSDLDLAAGSWKAISTSGRPASSPRSPVVTVHADETLDRAAQLMAEHSSAHLVVVEPGTGIPVGVLSTLDLARFAADWNGAGVGAGKERDAMKVSDVMTTDVLTVGSETPLRDVAALLTERRISGLPVVDEGRVVGVVSEGDILAKERGPRSERPGWFGVLFEDRATAELKLEARTAGTAMTAPALTIAPDRTVAEAAGVMVDEGVNRLPVVTAAGELVGIVTRADLVRAFVRTDTELADEIREHVLLKTLWITPGNVNVAVNEGVVTLRGEVENRATAEMLPDFVQRVPGVVAVRSDVTWEDENGRR